MPNDRRLIACTGVLAALACITMQAGRASAEDPPSEFHCGPIVVNKNGFVAFNVGNPDPSETWADLRVRVLNSNGPGARGVLLETPITLSPGQSRTVRWPATTGASSQTLVRGDVVVVSGPADLRLLGTFQIFGPELTYGPTVTCGTPIRGLPPPRPPA